MKLEKDAREGEWDFDGSCAPPETGGSAAWSGQETFSLGCFQWMRRGKAGAGKGLKKGKVTYRIKGSVHDPAAAYQSARSWCAKRNQEEFLVDGEPVEGLFTDYPIAALGDAPGVAAPVRPCRLLSWDQDKYVVIEVEGHQESIKAGYVYREHGRAGEVPGVTRRMLEVVAGRDPRAVAA